MDEQRLQAYLNLIEQLLGCASGEERAVLQQYAELVDAGLLTVMQQYAKYLDSQGNGNAAQWLLALARQLAEALGIADAELEETPEDLEQFLLTVLQLVEDSEGDAQQVYPFLAQHQEKLNEQLLQVLPQVATRFLTSEPEEQQDIAAILVSFGNLIQQFPLGQRWLNLELGIAVYTLALQVYTREAFPQEWAMTQHNRAAAYNERIRGERAENLEQAIRACQLALQVYTREAFPQEWAMTQNNLANAYCDRICGERAENLEQAIRAYTLALQVYTREALPQEWATTQNNLATAYFKRIWGERAENLEQAISTYQLALQVLTREAFPQEWAMTQNNLALAYSERIWGKHAENLEQAISTYQLALQVYTREGFPQDWAMTQNHLAGAYFERIRGERAENLEQAINTYQLALQVYTRKAFPQQWAMAQNNLAIAYRERIRGERAENLEQAIAASTLALQVYTREALPQQWAMTQNNLANAYLYRIRGERAKNLEQAIRACQLALQVYTREAFPQEWAMTQNNLANAYRERILGERAENLEQAIRACQLPLQVYTREALPQQWAMLQNSLANAYRERIRGKRPENLEQAIAAYTLALQVYTREAFPQEWAMTQNNLAGAYRERIRGERADNLERAIGAYQLALQVLTREAFPQDWAMTQNNLANAYQERIRGEQAENLERAISAYQLALQVFTPEAFPQEWAMTQNNLASAYCDRICGEKAENLEQAIAAYTLALHVRTREAFPQEWAATQNNLALAYSERIRGERAENLEQAIGAYTLALHVRTREAFPQEWAMTQNNLALAYNERIRGERVENLEQAIAAYTLALQVRTREAFPQDCRQTARNLGNLHFEQKGWTEAASAYTLALQANEILYQSAIFLDGKAAELTETSDLPRRAAYALARSGNLQAAALTLEQGRARGLSETLERDRADLTQLQQLVPALYTQYAAITTQLRNLETQQRLRMTSDDRHSLTPEAYRTEALRLRQTLTEIIDQIRQVPGYEGFLAQPSFDDILQALRPGIPLVYLVPTSAGSLSLIVTPDSIVPLWLDDLTETRLEEILNAWFNAYDQSQANHPAWLDAIDQGTRQLWQPLMAPLIDYLKQNNFQQATLIPTGFLNLLPLHAAWTEAPTAPTGRHYALDAIHFTYAPNARSLSTAQDIAQRTVADSILVIDEPKHDNASPLPNSKREVQVAIATFPNRNVLRHEQATREAILAALPDYNVLHCSCHGKANLEEPLKSGLAMTGKGEAAILTLRDLLDLKLNGIRLAILSACETGLAGIELADEVISLPTGLLQAGVAGVVASLWSVSELSTMVLLSRFYTLWRDQHLEPSQALIKAQQWLRDSKPRDVVAHCETFIPELASREVELKRSLKLKFSHPYFWAAFSYMGA